MAREITFQHGQSHRREFVKVFKSLCQSHSVWSVWQDVIYLIAAELSQPFNYR
jgi:hypothetical protein